MNIFSSLNERYYESLSNGTFLNEKMIIIPKLSQKLELIFQFVKIAICTKCHRAFNSNMEILFINTTLCIILYKYNFITQLITLLLFTYSLYDTSQLREQNTYILHSGSQNFLL